jgi:uncharacterized membrane protein
MTSLATIKYNKKKSRSIDRLSLFLARLGWIHTHKSRHLQVSAHFIMIELTAAACRYLNAFHTATCAGLRRIQSPLADNLRHRT